MWKNDNFFIGLLAALISVIVTAGLIIFLAPLIYNQLNMGAPQMKVVLLSIVPAVIIMRYYFRKLQFSRSGSGALIVVFACIILYFLILDKSPDSFPFL